MKVKITTEQAEEIVSTQCDYAEIDGNGNITYFKYIDRINELEKENDELKNRLDKYLHSNTVTDGVKSILIDKLGVIESEFSLDSALSDYGCDDLDFVEIIMTVDRKFNISLEESKYGLDEHSTVREVIEAIERGIKIKHQN